MNRKLYYQYKKQGLKAISRARKYRFLTFRSNYKDYRPINSEDWFDFYHCHNLQWWNIDSKNLEFREPFIKSIFILYKKLKETLESRYKHPYQIWICIHEQDPNDDAVYIHSKNPNEDNFPAKFDTVDFTKPVPRWLSEYMNEGEYKAGVATDNENGIVYYIFPIDYN